MILTEKFGEFTIYQDDIANSFIYTNFDNHELFMNGLADYILSETNLLNYANALTPINFVPTNAIYKKLYSTLGTFLNSELECLTFNEVSGDVFDILRQEYQFTNKNGETLIQKDKIGKIGEYTLHLLLTNYYKLHCIIPKFRCTTDRNMCVFGIDALYYDPSKHMILFGESKVCNNIDNAITLINQSFEIYEEQISEEYKLILSNNEVFNLSDEFREVFQKHTDICISFKQFIQSAKIKRIGIPAFLAHGNGNKNNSAEFFLRKMNSKLKRNQYFDLDTEYIFISLPIIDKAKMLDIIMRKVVEKNNEYRARLSGI